MKLITKTQDLTQAISLLSQSDFITIDTEFHRETTFWPTLCLIQMATPQLAVLIDPLASGIDLTAFFELMANKKIIKVFHSARQDIEIILHLGNLIPSPLFDTQIAAMVCGYGDSVSYDRLVLGVTGHQLDKSSRFTDWSQRPLSANQLSYALADVTFLVDVYLALYQQLQDSGRMHWLHEEMLVLSSKDTYMPAPETAWKKVKGRVTKPRELAILQKLSAWREEQAQQNNVPRRSILKDEYLIEIAIQQPKELTTLLNLRGIGKHNSVSLDKNKLNDIITMVQAVLKQDIKSLPKLSPIVQSTSKNKNEIEFLKLLLKITAERHHVSEKILATNDDLAKISEQRQHANVPAMHNWRFEIFGKHALDLLSGKIAIQYVNGEICLLNIES